MKIEVVATTRKAQGTGASRRLRKSGLVPGIVYGSDKPAAQIEIEHQRVAPTKPGTRTRRSMSAMTRFTANADTI